MDEQEKTAIFYIDALQALCMTGKAETTSEKVTAALIKRGIVGEVKRDPRENLITLFRRGYVGT